MVASVDAANSRKPTLMQATAVAHLANMKRGDNQHTAIAASSQADAAARLNVRVDSVQRAAQVWDEGAPKRIAAVEQGRIAASQAAASRRASTMSHLSASRARFDAWLQ